MEELRLYAKQYNGTDDFITQVDNGERILSIYQGIIQHRATRGNITYPALRYLGNVNITRRIFYKGAKHSRKVIHQEDDNVILFNYGNNNEHTYTLIPTLFRDLGYQDTLLNEIIEVVIRESNNPRLKTFSNYRIGGENDGIVNF